jgi:hypothetical protein
MVFARDLAIGWNLILGVCTLRRQEPTGGYNCCRKLKSAFV